MNSLTFDANLFTLLHDWHSLTHHLRHRCGYIVPAIDINRACKNCSDGVNIATYIDVWVWT